MSDDIRPFREPFDVFREIYDEAAGTGMTDPNAMVVSSVDAEGQPSSRVVLLKSFDEKGFVFYTNLESRKGREIQAHPKVSLDFFWRELGRQVVVLGTAEPVSDEEADAYFATRHRSSQLGAWVSKQSRPLVGGRGHWVDDDGTLQFRRDVYGQDAKVAAGLARESLLSFDFNPARGQVKVAL